VPHTKQRFGAANEEGFQIDLWLVPYFQPALLHGSFKIDPRCHRIHARHGGGVWDDIRGLRVGQRVDPCPEIGDPERLEQRLQHVQPVQMPDAVDLGQDKLIATADQKDAALEFQDLQPANDVPGVGLTEGQVQDQEVGFGLGDR
jgi:hypothetical protein